MMKKKFYQFVLLALLAIAGPARGVDLITVIIAPTNTTSSGNGVTLNGNLRYGTNALSGTTWITNASPAQSATNLLIQLQSYQINLGWSIQMTNTNTIVIYGAAPLTASVTAGWASLTLQTNTGTNHHAFMVPYKTNPPTTKTNDVSDILEAIGSSVPTNTVPPTAPGFVQFLNTTTAQTASNKTFVAGVLDGTRGTNLIGLNGTVNRLTNGNYKTPILESPVSTNGVNYGTAFSSPGTAAFSQQFGGGTATNSSATATGDGSIAGGIGSSAYGQLSISLGDFSTAVGYGSAAPGYGSASVGVSTMASGRFSSTLGSSTVASFENSTAIGYQAATTQSNQVMIGSSTVTLTSVKGRLEASGGITNITALGTNQWNGDLAWVSAAYSSMANTNNTIPASNNTVYYLSGSTTAHDIAGAAGGRSNLRVRYWDSGTLPLTIRNLGGGASAGNRIRTRTGNDVTLTNNPACFELEYSATASEWLYIPLGN